MNLLITTFHINLRRITLLLAVLLIWAAGGCLCWLNAQEEVAILKLSTEEFTNGLLTESSTLSLPFDLVSNLIWFEAEVEGEQGNFILDTGVPTLVLHQELNDESATAIGIGAGGQETLLSEGEVSSFQLAGIEQGEQRSLGLDLSGLAQRSERELLGIVGFEQLHAYELLIDYAAQQFHLFPARRNELHRLADPKFSLRFDYLDHLPVLVLKQEQRTLHFAIDTGAGSNLIDPNVFEDGVIAEPLNVQTTVRGLAGGIEVQPNFVIDNLSRRNQIFSPQTFVAVDLDHISTEGIAIDGILGQPFLQQHRISIDFKRQKIHFWN